MSRPATDGPRAAAGAQQDAVEVTSCQLCGSRHSTPRFADGPFRVLECSDCGLVYVTPRLRGTALLDVYGESYWKSDDPKRKGYADYAREAELYLKTFARRMRTVRRWLKPGARVLDVGCAAGYFLRVVEREGHPVFGVEPSAAIAAEAVRHLGAERVHVGTLAEAVAAGRVRPGSFDLVTLWDVIEHVPDPQGELAAIRTLLAPGGRLLLETQNVASRWARLLGRRWHHYKHEEHLFHFAPATIRRLLSGCGYRVLDLGSGDAGKYVSFAFLAERAGRLGRVPGLLAAPLRLFAGLSVYVNPRDEMIVVAEPA